jgi:hypothetical protein
MSRVLKELVLQHPFDAFGPSHCTASARHFSLNSNEKYFSESTLFLRLPSCVLLEKMCPALAELVPQHTLLGHLAPVHDGVAVRGVAVGEERAALGAG